MTFERSVNTFLTNITKYSNYIAGYTKNYILTIIDYWYIESFHNSSVVVFLSVKGIKYSILYK